MERWLAIAAGLVAILTALKLLSENFEKILNSYERWREKRNRPRYVLIPTLEELARYSVKEPDRHYPTAADIEAMLAASLRRSEDIGMTARVGLLMIGFAIIFALLGARLLYLGLMSSLSPS